MDFYIVCDEGVVAHMIGSRSTTSNHIVLGFMPSMIRELLMNYWYPTSKTSGSARLHIHHELVHAVDYKVKPWFFTYCTFQGPHSQGDLIDKLTAHTHLFIGQFNNLLRAVPTSWGFWFSDAQDVNQQWYPQGILPWQVIDYMGNLNPVAYITRCLDGLRSAMPERQGASLENFNKLKKYFNTRCQLC